MSVAIGEPAGRHARLPQEAVSEAGGRVTFAKPAGRSIRTADGTSARKTNTN